MKTMKILAATLLTGIAFNASAFENPDKINIPAPAFMWVSTAEVAVALSGAAEKTVKTKFRNPEEIVEEGLNAEAFTLGFPEMRFDNPEDVTLNVIDEPALIIFKNPEAIVEEGLKEGAFTVGFPKFVWGDPAEVTIEVPALLNTARK